MSYVVNFNEKTWAIELNEAVISLIDITNGMDSSINIERKNNCNPIAKAEYAKLESLIKSAKEIVNAMSESVARLNLIKE